jgi:LuxR family quorum-sensing system transcriptional regulator CciR
VEAYVARNIVANDPVLLASERTNAGFIWDEVGNFIEVTADHRLVTEDTRHAGLVAGYTVPANVPGEANGSCNFAVRAGHALPIANLPMAQVVGAFAFQAARTLVLKAKDAGSKFSKVSLTQRQLECILFVARGKTDWEIGQILGISEETVKRHLADARDRYDVSKRMQVVMRAVYEGKIAMSDILH